jgi:hypothetical protein
MIIVSPLLFDLPHLASPVPPRSDLAAQFEERSHALDAQWAAKQGEHERALAAVVADIEVPPCLKFGGNHSRQGREYANHQNISQAKINENQQHFLPW